MTATSLDLSQIKTDALVSAATFRTLIGVYSEAEVDALAANYATAAQGALADSALQPSDITSGTITAGTGDIDFDDLGASSPLTLTASSAAETPLTVKAAAGQTASLQKWQSSSGGVFAAISYGPSSFLKMGESFPARIGSNTVVGAFTCGNSSGFAFPLAAEMIPTTGGDSPTTANGTINFGRSTIRWATLFAKTMNCSESVVPGSLADAAAPNNSIYYSTDAAKLVYKDSTGTVNDLY